MSLSNSVVRSALSKQQPTLGGLVEPVDPLVASLPPPAAASPKLTSPKQTGRRRIRSGESLEDRVSRARLEKEVAVDQQGLGVVTSEQKDGDIDKTGVAPVPEELDEAIDARRSQEFRGLPEDIRIRGDQFYRGLERSRVGLISERELYDLSQPFFRENQIPNNTQGSLVRTWYNKWTVVRGRTKRKMFQLFRHHGVVDQSWLSEDRAACIAARFFLRDQEVTPTDAELKRVRQMLASYLDPEQQRHVTRTLKDGSPRASGVPSDV